jgi:hypothetical protein
MQSDLHRQVTARLKTEFSLVDRGVWLRQGKCPKCGKKELYANAEGPWVVICGRVDKCGHRQHVKEIFHDLFDNWSERFAPTEQNPTASADAYLQHARGLNLAGLRGAYTQEYFHDRARNIGSATVRFPLPGADGSAGGYWERIIDQPHRFGSDKARFATGSKYKGECWVHPSLTIDKLAAAPEIWIVEGIFDSVSIHQRHIAAVSAMSCYNYPDAFLARIAAACAEAKRPRPAIVWAFDSNKAGRRYAREFAGRASKTGWHCTAALTEEKPAAKPRDWNDLHIIDSEDVPTFSADRLADYRWNGDILLASSAIEKAKLITAKKGWSAFTVEHGTRLYWASVNEARVAELIADMTADPATQGLSAAEKREMAIDNAMAITDIANCAFEPLYFQFDDVAGEGSYYFQLDFPADLPSIKALVSATQIVSAPDFTKRLAALSPAAVYKGSTFHLQHLREQWRGIRTVIGVYATGYIREHGAYVFPDHAVHAGKVYPINKEDYFEIGKLAVKPTSSERLLEITWEQGGFRPDWLGSFWATFGARGMVALSFWFGTLFAEQIRAKQQSWPFIEIWGEPGGGKTTIIEFLWRLLGRADYEGFDPSKSTAAARARNLGKVGNLPVVLIESDRDSSGAGGARQHGKQFDWDELKTAYNGRSVRSRGVANGGMDTFEPPFRGAIVISQNESVNASPAIMERIVSLEFNKAMQNKATRTALDRLQGLDPAALSSFIIEAVRLEPKVMERYLAAFPAREAEIAAAGKTRNNRLVKNHAQLLAALDALAPMIRLDEAIHAETADFIINMAGERHQALSADHPAVVDFWETFNYIHQSQVEAAKPGDEGPPIEHSRDANTIAISLKQFEQFCADRRLSLPGGNLADLRRHLKTSKNPRWLGDKSVNSRHNKILHCWVFERAPASKPASAPSGATSKPVSTGQTFNTRKG